MGKSTPSAPAAVNPEQVAGRQAVYNTASAIAQQRLNNTNQVTPYGSLTYEETGGGYDSNNTWVPSFTATTKLSPEQQNLYDTQTRVQQGAYDLADQYTGRIAEATSKPYSYDGLPGAPTYNEDYRRQQVGNIIARNQPQMDRDRAMLEQRLADQGVGMQDPAYRSAWDQYQRGVNDFRLGADIQGGTEAANMYGLEANTRDRAIAEMTNLRSQPINEVSALLGTGSVRDPTFVNTPQTQVAPTDVVGAYGLAAKQQQAAYDAQMRSNAAATGGLFGLGGSALMAGGMWL